jgi:hypothetical protein
MDKCGIAAWSLPTSHYRAASASTLLHSGRNAATMSCHEGKEKKGEEERIDLVSRFLGFGAGWSQYRVTTEI